MKRPLLRDLLPMFSVLIAGVFLVGCDPFWGLTRSFHTDQPISTTCIQQAFDQVSEIHDVQYQAPDVKQVPHLHPSITQLHSYTFEIGTLQSALTWEVYDSGQSELRQGFSAMGRRPVQSDVDIIRPIMINIEHALQARCGISNLESRVTEHCALPGGVECLPPATH